MCLNDQFFHAVSASCGDIRILRAEPMSHHTSFRTGGPAQIACPRTEESLRALLELCSRSGVRVRILGAGTNVLAPDAGMEELVICLKDGLTGLHALSGSRIEAYAGESLARTAIFAREQGLTGLEFAHGIPGSVGGGVFMNAGAYGSELSGVLESVTYLDLDGARHTVLGEQAQLGYRDSIFQHMPCVVVKAVFALQAGDKEQIDQTMRVLMARRKASQPLELPSAGSTFKRPTGHYAGALIEQAGLKGTAVGGAQVSEKHAGFLVNAGGASTADVLALIRLVQQKVFEQSGVRLEPEVRIW